MTTTCWDVMPCGSLSDTDLSKEHTASTVKAKEVTERGKRYVIEKGGL